MQSNSRKQTPLLQQCSSKRTPPTRASVASFAKSSPDSIIAVAPSRRTPLTSPCLHNPCLSEYHPDNAQIAGVWAMKPTTPCALRRQRPCEVRKDGGLRPGYGRAKTKRWIGGERERAVVPSIVRHARAKGIDGTDRMYRRGAGGRARREDGDGEGEEKQGLGAQAGWAHECSLRAPGVLPAWRATPNTRSKARKSKSTTGKTTSPSLLRAEV